MATGKALNGKPYAGNPHVRFDEGEVASAATPRRGSLLYNKTFLCAAAAMASALCAFAAAPAEAEIARFAKILREPVLPASDRFLAHDLVLRELSVADKAADDAWRALKSRSEYDEYRAAMHRKYVEAVGGLAFERTPLNAKVTGKVARDGYRIEKVLFESRRLPSA